MRGWDRILNGAAIHAVPGNHVTMMSNPENRKVLARMLSRALNTSPTTHAKDRIVYGNERQSVVCGGQWRPANRKQATGTDLMKTSSIS
ncbi:hypothetical protein AJ87_07610 [Rhizobium yanglingense]|nr:hypothetical protein AJ87_07610 [Rhizobium yanglingense]